MEQLIEALQIFLKYGNPGWPTGCEHEKLYVFIDPAIVSPEDKAKLEELRFFVSEDEPDVFYSFRYGSA